MLLISWDGCSKTRLLAESEQKMFGGNSQRQIRHRRLGFERAEGRLMMAADFGQAATSTFHSLWTGSTAPISPAPYIAPAVAGFELAACSRSIERRRQNDVALDRAGPRCDTSGLSAPRDAAAQWQRNSAPGHSAAPRDAAAERKGATQSGQQ